MQQNPNYISLRNTTFNQSKNLIPLIMKKMTFLLIASCWFLAQPFAQKKEAKPTTPILFEESTLSGLNFRLVGPALTSGRVVDIAVHPTNADKWYIAAASGGVWFTENHGTTFSPIFDNYGSYSTACIELAPSNPTTIWLGTGENNNQRSVAYGDGVYKSLDGGKSFTNMGLKLSEHIGNIIIHPTNENIVWVAAYGPLWSSGGERGVYKTTDGGKTWERTLFVSDQTGVSEITIDPNNPDILYAAAHQRRRQEWTYVGGGPESTLYKSTDGGKTWREITTGLPKGQMGRIGIAIPPSDNNYLYAIVEAREGKGGIYRSTNKGENFTKMSGFSTLGNYYQEIMCDPLNKEKIFIMDTYLHHSEDGGKTVKETGEHQKHVDNHAIWIDPKNTNHWLVGCDGGIYETFNHAQQWHYYSNLPIIQFYKVTTDNASPFYNIYGGTQDNNSQGGAAATLNVHGITNADWFITNGGDGFESACDPTNPAIAYAQSQYGGLVRHDKATGEKVFIQPLPKEGEAAYRWNWDAPLLISPHDNKTLYFAANRVFKSSNRGDDWQTISPDLSQQIDRNNIKVMGQVWTIDAVMKNQSTTIYGNIIALDESPKKKGLLYAGTDDGCVQISENDGASWTKTTTFPGIPANTRVNMLTASTHNENVVFAVFNNIRSGDFKPYLLKSSDKGKTWNSIAGNLPERGSVYCIKQDFIDPNLLFVGTEFGAYFSVDGGKQWTKLSGLPTIAVPDLEIQQRENDLVAATFGRGFYVLDNFSPLRNLKKEYLDKKAHLFPVKDALLYVPADPLGLEGTGFQGANLWTTPNPEFGAVFSLFVKDDYKTLKEIRQEKEATLEKDKKDVSYPTFDELRKESMEASPQFIYLIRNAEGKEVRRIIKAPTKGISRVSWNLRTESTYPISANSELNNNNGFLVPAGNYSVEIFLLKDGKIETIVEKTTFTVKSLNNQTLAVENPREATQFRTELEELSRSVSGAGVLLSETTDKLKILKRVILTYPNTDLSWLAQITQLEQLADSCNIALNEDGLKHSKEVEVLPGISQRLGTIYYMLYNNTTGVTQTQRNYKAIVEKEYAAFREKLNRIILATKTIEKALDGLGIPYIEGKDEGWKKEKD
jgi:photosystem II stability/assembly factor-like uncharacterized protein